MGRRMILLFAVTAFTSAFLLFWIEPLFARMVLPLLGGSPGVWNSCLMFFQAALLGGYLYAHVLTRSLRVRQQAVVHLTLLALACLALPIAIPRGWQPPAAGNVVGWLLLVLTVSVGAPFVLLSATAPLVQRWLATADSRSSVNPYVLYAASNAGSFCGLLAFPLLLEPSMRLGQQAAWWSAGYTVAIVLVLLSVTRLWQLNQQAGGTTGIAAEVTLHRADEQGTAHAFTHVQAEADGPAPTTRDRLRWIALAFVPSSLLLGVTTFLSTDVAAAPFLWVVPLALYLLTFIIAFARTSRATRRVPVAVHAVLATTLVLLSFWGSDIGVKWSYSIHLGVFVMTALVLHSELASARPAPAHLTEYYLWLALGGALGGAFNALVAPQLFTSVAEYRAMVVIACFLRPSRLVQVAAAGDAPRFKRFLSRARVLLDMPGLVPLALLPAVLVGVTMALGAADRPVLGIPLVWISSVSAALVALAFSSRAWKLGVALVAVSAARMLLVKPDEQLLYAGRSFFGTYRVTTSDRARFLFHGTTIHGAQFLDSTMRLRPTTYYHPSGPMGQVFDSLKTMLAGRRVGLVGLGAGTLLCYSTPGQQWTIFEIDPLVERIARDPSNFTFLRDCAVRPNVVIGDARLTLAREPARTFSLLVLDAFSSDAIPVHLLTREALAMYRHVMAPGGVILVHISNRHLDLEPVVSALAADAGLVAYMSEHAVDEDVQDTELDYDCDWILLAARDEDAGALRTDTRWRRLTPPVGKRPWSDDYSNVFGAIKWE